MLFVDRATGSKDLVKPLRDLGLPAELETLEYGDIAFYGRGEKGAPLHIGIEYKKLPELVTALNTKRFQGHQLPGMVQEFDRYYLLVEGTFHHDAHGQPTMWRRGQQVVIPGAANAIELEQTYLTFLHRAGCPVIERATQRDALRWVAAAYRWWKRCDLEEHNSHYAMYAPDMDTRLRVPMSGFRVAVNNLFKKVDGGVGIAGSKALETACAGSMRRLCMMTVNQLADIDVPDRNGKTKKLGLTRAQRIWEELG